MVNYQKGKCCKLEVDKSVSRNYSSLKTEEDPSRRRWKDVSGYLGVRHSLDADFDKVAEEVCDMNDPLKYVDL